MTRHRATVDFVSPSGSKCPHVGVNVCGYLPEQRQWQVLVLRDNSYLPEDLQRPPTGWQRILIEFIAQWQVLTRRLQYLLGGKKEHAIHRDYYPVDDDTWYWHLWKPSERRIRRWNRRFRIRINTG
jgi:hypothetical protein